MLKSHIRGNQVSLTPAIEEYIAKKSAAFEKYINPSDTSASLYVEVGKVTEHHKQGDIFRAEFNLHIAGRQLRSEAEAPDLNTAIDQAKDELVEELRTTKDKEETMFRKGSRKIKDIVRNIYGRWN